MQEWIALPYIVWDVASVLIRVQDLVKAADPPPATLLRAGCPRVEEDFVFKPNYNQQRAERRRSQQAKQEKKQRERQEAVAARRAARAETMSTDETKTSDGK